MSFVINVSYVFQALLDSSFQKNNIHMSKNMKNVQICLFSNVSSSENRKVPELEYFSVNFLSSFFLSSYSFFHNFLIYFLGIRSHFITPHTRNNHFR